MTNNDTATRITVRVKGHSIKTIIDTKDGIVIKKLQLNKLQLKL